MKSAIILLPGINPFATKDLFPTFKEKFSKDYLVEEITWDVNTNSLNELLLIISKKIDETKVKGYQNIILVGKSFGGFMAVLHQFKFNCAKLLVLLSPSLFICNENLVYDKLHKKFSDIGLIKLIMHREDLNKINVPTLLIHAMDDDIVPFNNSEKLANFLSKVTFVSIPTGGHSYKGFESIVAEKIAAWAKLMLKG